MLSNLVWLASYLLGGLVPSWTLTSFSSLLPGAITLNLTVSPTLCFITRSTSVVSPVSSTPSNLVMMLFATMPALSAGLPDCTALTNIPCCLDRS